MSDLLRIASAPGWSYVELSLDIEGPEGYLTLKLLELLGVSINSYTSLTLTVLTTGANDGNFTEGTEDNRFPVDRTVDQFEAFT